MKAVGIIFLSLVIVMLFASQIFWAGMISHTTHMEEMAHIQDCGLLSCRDTGLVACAADCFIAGDFTSTIPAILTKITPTIFGFIAVFAVLLISVLVVGLAPAQLASARDPIQLLTIRKRE